ncbi:MAG TPA: hypothetical protein VGS41_13850 [Chthonomonadales bacterium]|nr:hypothetical protein [Chthonomonadales bacterium]
MASDALYLIAAGLALAVPVLPVCLWFLHTAHLRAINFRGASIPTATGLIVVAWSLGMFAAICLRFPDLRAYTLNWVICAGGFACLGFIDDVWGSRKTLGLKGHLLSTLKGKPTTGFLKAVGGLALAMATAWSAGAHRPAEWLVDSGLIALAANAINLLDLRPGRAGAVYLVSQFLLLMPAEANLATRRWALVPAILSFAEAMLWNWDSKAAVMMGDTGSNALGAALGLSATLFIPDLVARCAILVFLVALHLVAERVSLSAVIEGNGFFRAADRLTGVR